MQQVTPFSTSLLAFFPFGQ